MGTPHPSSPHRGSLGPHAVTSVQRPGGTDTFTYDANGNMTSRTEGGVIWTQDFNAENRLASISWDPDGAGPLPLKIWSFVYDGDGNRVKQVDPDGKVTLLLGGGLYIKEMPASGPPCYQILFSCWAAHRDAEKWDIIVLAHRSSWFCGRGYA